MKNNFKRSFTILTAIALLLSATVFALNKEPEASEASAAPINEEPAFVYKTGIIEEVSKEQITIKQGDELFVLNLSEETEIISADLLPVEFDKVKKGMYAGAVCLPMISKSIPPQLPADMIILSDSQSLPIYAEIARTETDEYGNLSVITADGDYIFAISDECEIIPFKTRNILTKNDLSRGDRVLVYTDILTLSLPAKAAPEKIAVLENSFEDENISAPAEIDTDSSVNKEQFEEFILNINNGSENITREGFCEILYKTAENYGINLEVPTIQPFADTQSAACGALYGLGVVKGTGDSKFSPHITLNREEAATIFDRLLLLVSPSERAMPDKTFADDGDISDWAKTAVCNMADSGIIPDIDGSFLPKNRFSVSDAANAAEKLFNIVLLSR